MCKNHPDKKHYGKGLCRSCYKREYRRNRPIEMAEREKEWAKQYAILNAAAISERRAKRYANRSDAKRAEHKEYYQRLHAKRNASLSPEEKERKRN